MVYVDISCHLRLKYLQHFWEWICLHFQVEMEEEGPTVVAPYEHCLKYQSHLL